MEAGTELYDAEGGREPVGAGEYLLDEPGLAVPFTLGPWAGAGEYLLVACMAGDGWEADGKGAYGLTRGGATKLGNPLELERDILGASCLGESVGRFGSDADEGNKPEAEPGGAVEPN